MQPSHEIDPLDERHENLLVQASLPIRSRSSGQGTTETGRSVDFRAKAAVGCAIARSVPNHRGSSAILRVS